MIESSKEVYKTVCPECKSNGWDWDKDNLSVYDDLHAYCHACKYYIKRYEIMTETTTNITASSDFKGEYKAIEDRAISNTTCKFLGVQTGTIYNQPCRLYEYDNGQKLRILPKQFTWISGSPKDCSMLGLDKAKDYTAPIIITEGEDDTLSCWEKGFQACSLHSGAGSIKQCLQHDKNTLLKFKEIWLWMDNDEVGQQALKQALEELPQDKVKIVKSEQFKDANEALLAGKLEELLQSSVIEYRPEGIIFGNELDWDKIWEDRPEGLQLPWEGLQKAIKGLHKGRLYLIGGGSAVGKSTVLRELVYYYRINYPALKIAHLFLEEDQDTGPLTYCALHENIPIGELIENKNLISKEKRETLKNLMFNNNNLMFTDAQYDLGDSELLKQLEYLATIKKYDIIILDHISMVADASDSKENERIVITKLMRNLRSLVRRTGLTVIAACHLSNPDIGKDWEEGREVKQKDFHGSSALRKVPDVMIGIERNARDPYSCDLLSVRVIKNRWFGKVGITDTLIYFENSGRLERKKDE